MTDRVAESKLRGRCVALTSVTSFLLAGLEIVGAFLRFEVLLRRGFLILLILRHQIVHVRLCLGEFHVVHTFTSVPMQEGLSPEHRRELFGDPLEQLLNGGGVADEGGRHLQPLRRDVADRRLHIVRYPFDEVRAVLILYAQHLLVNLLHGHPTAENGRNGEVPAMARIAGRHHVLCVKHLLSELRHGKRRVLLHGPGGERRETRHEEMQTWERHHVHCELP